MKRLKDLITRYIKGFKEFTVFNWAIFSLSWVLLILIMALIPKGWGVLILGIGLIVFILIMVLNNNRFRADTNGNGIIYGGRGKGKGLLLQKKINSYKKVFSNVPFGDNTEIINIKEYIQSIGNNTIMDAIEGTIEQVKKIEKFEGVNVFWDDLTVYAPNFMDRELKLAYPSLPLTLAINRHLYNSFMIITTQDRERPYKLLRELQTDFSVKALGTTGWGSIWSSLPLLRHFVVVKYRYYEEVRASEAGVLPFDAKGLTNRAVKHAWISAGQATKEQFEATHGKVYHGRAWIRKSEIKYDTRYFHELFFGVKSPTSED